MTRLLGNQFCERSQRVRLREAVLYAGGQLGWTPCQVVHFAEVLTARPWKRCGPDELEAVFDEYRAIARVIRAKAAKRGGHDAPSD